MAKTFEVTLKFVVEAKTPEEAETKCFNGLFNSDFRPDLDFEVKEIKRS